MKIEISSDIHLSVSEVSSLEDVVRAQLLNRVLDINIFVDDIENAKEDFWIEYERALVSLADLVILLHKRKRWNAAVNVLTDPFLALYNVPTSFVMCTKCPCQQCMPNPELFERFTGFENIPPQFYCRKSFLELKASRKIAEEVFGKEVSDIDEKDWMEFCIMKSGGMEDAGE